jgi:hypothetical protein
MLKFKCVYCGQTRHDWISVPKTLHSPEKKVAYFIEILPFVYTSIFRPRNRISTDVFKAINGNRVPVQWWALQAQNKT